MKRLSSEECRLLEDRIVELEPSEMRVQDMAVALGIEFSTVERMRRNLIAEGRIEPRHHLKGRKGEPGGDSVHSRPPMRVYEVKTRACLMCRSKFKSTWPGERVCKQCRGTAAWKSGTE